ncbi:MAG: winged helix-turn-helix transcriptional regulator [Actinomycetota bacterium]|nr:winged helix-turn-helix transcriptional regulator [Actinomycetota bacterium]
MKTYGQYCPIARTSEFFAERWTPIIIRNLGAGCRTFTQIREGAPGIPKALLTERLALLERYGVVEREPRPTGRGFEYSLTESGRELKHVCDAMGEWGAHWLEIEPRHLDPAYALWATCRLVDLDRVPEAGVVLRFELTDAARPYWMVLRRPRAEVCTAYPGRAEDLVVRTDAQTLVGWNLRQLTLAEAIASGRLEIEGPPRLAKGFGVWVRPSPFSAATLQR